MSSYGAALSEHPDSASAAGEVIGEILEAVGPSPDLAVLFASASHREAVGDLADAIHQALAPAALLGATAVSVIGGPVEAQERPAVSLWAAARCPARSIRLEPVRGSGGWALGGMPVDGEGTLLVLPDPFSFPSETLLDAGSAMRVVGGLASAAGRPGDNRLVLGQQVFSDGAVGVLLDPGVEVRTVVSQGCRPIGQPFTVTKAEGNIVSEMGGRTAVDRLRETLLGLDEADRSLLAKGLHIGIVIDEHQSDFDRGDFLIRGLIGADEETGALAVGESVGVGTTLQFQVRDAATADEDLRELMAGASAGSALVFTCNGRGTRLFEGPNHDAAVVHEALDRAPVAGMFCAGEFGPVAGRNFLHGFTASVVLFP
ncbi:MAG: FIST C-terminal domain-containing protein [bacterium]|nr:FIST C-terminal domain-containing protein [bacterium]MCY4273578.1 FIST C-terminal domain-containing protein [bacterium]